MGLLRHWSHALTAGRAGRKVIQRIAEMLPPALFFNEFAASLGALARLGRRAKARHEKLVAAGRAGRKVIQRIAEMLPPALFFNEFAASLGALARLGKTC